MVKISRLLSVLHFGHYTLGGIHFLPFFVSIVTLNV